MDLNMNDVEFYFSDLRPEAQQRFLSAQGLASAEEGNYDLDIVPLFSVECRSEVEHDG